MLPFLSSFLFKKPFIKKTIRENPIKKINGFYGLIGPDFEANQTQSLFDLFTKNGLIQGIFFNEGNVTFQKHRVQTDKLLWEKKGFRFSQNMFFHMFYKLINPFNLLPNILGVANTAILDADGRFYAMYERDLPYELSIDFEKKDVGTIGKIAVPGVHRVSGHTKYDENSGLIETIDYDMGSKSVTYFSLNKQFQVLKKREVFFKYFPNLHDFCTLGNNVFLLDAPFVFDFQKIFANKIPFAIDPKRETYIHVLNNTDDSLQKYTCKTGFTVFHFAGVTEDPDGYNLYASIYETFDFNNLDILGKYRCIRLDKRTREITIEKKELFDEYNLDFPVSFGNQTIFRNINNERNCVDGFIIVEELNLVKEILFSTREIFGEPRVIYADQENPYLCFFNKKEEKYCVSLLHLLNGKINDFDLDERITLGFHSIFVNR